MGWEQVGQGIFPTGGIKAPTIQAADNNGKTMFVIEMPRKLNSKEIDKLIQQFYEQGKQLLNPPILENSAASASTSLKDLLILNEEMQEMFLSFFSGIRIRQDYCIRDNDWYCGVSPEIFERLRKRQ